MKKELLVLVLCLSAFYSQAQLPYIATPTLIPKNPTTASSVKIVTKVTTPNLGVIVNIATHTVTGQQIKISSCYGQGMMPATQTFIDTLVIGLLPPGNYQITQSAFLSSTNQHCTPIDSNVVSLSINVTNTLVTGTDATPAAGFKALALWPNPCVSTLLIDDTSGEAEVVVLSVSGALVKRTRLNNKALDVRDLKDGFYFLKVLEKDRVHAGKFIKSGTGQ